MKKLRKNKFVVLAICVIIVSVLYFCAQKVIDNYAFKMNEDIVSEEESDLYQEETGSMNANENDRTSENERQIPNEEIDLVLEEDEIEGTQSEDGSSTNAGEKGDLNFADANKNADNQNKIYVYITGEVNVPGVVILNGGSRIVDAINAAGGTTIKANVSKVNLVYVLDDGMKVNIPSDEDLKNNPDFEYITMNSGDGGNDDYYGASSTESSSSNGGTGSGSSSNTSSGSSKKYSIVNINTATQTELETLPGIGPSLALKIVNYRKENGKFSSIDDIKNVSGIGESKFESLKSYITV